MILLGGVKPYGSSSWVFTFGDKDVGNYEQKVFSIRDYGSSAKAKAAAIAYQKNPTLQKRLKDNSVIGKRAKEFGMTYDKYASLSAKEKQKLSYTKFAVKKRAEREAAGGFKQSFTHKGKTYTVSTRIPKNQIEQLKEFLKSLDEWKAGGGTLESYNQMPSRLKAMAAAKNVGKKTSTFDNRAGAIWRRLRDFAQGKPPTGGRSGTGELYKTFFEQLDLSKPELNTIKTFDYDTIQADKQKLITGQAAIKKVGNPLIKTVIDVVKKNPNITTEQELFVEVSKAAGKGLSNAEITKAAILAHRAGSTRLLKEARKEISELALAMPEKYVAKQDLDKLIEFINERFNKLEYKIDDLKK